MTAAFRILPLALAILCAAPALAAQNDALPRSTPEAQGVSSEGIRAFIEAVDAEIDTMHSFMLVRHGHVIAEAWWGDESAEKAHILWSLSKSFTSTAIGMAIADGKLSLDDRVLKFFPDEAPEKPSWQLNAMRVRDLMTMSTGHQDEPSLWGEEDWVKRFLAHPVPHKPGTHFRYNTPATYMLSAILQKQTGQTVNEYLLPRLFEPLGIDKPRWDQSPEGVSIGGFGLFLKTEDIAKFGQLYLQRGKWGKRQLLSPSWVDQATSKQTSNGSNPKSDWDQGYGFQFWRCRNNAYRADGKDGQFCIVLPELDAVIVMTAKSKDMAAQLELTWSKLLPAFADEALAANAQSLAALNKSIQALATDH